MSEAQAAGVQVYGTVRIGASGAIAHITFDGAFDVSHLSSYLVMPAGVEGNFYEVIAVAAS